MPKAGTLQSSTNDGRNNRLLVAEKRTVQSTIIQIPQKIILMLEPLGLTAKIDRYCAEGDGAQTLEVGTSRFGLNEASVSDNKKRLIDVPYLLYVTPSVPF